MKPVVSQKRHYISYHKKLTLCWRPELLKAQPKAMVAMLYEATFSQPILEKITNTTFVLFKKLQAFKMLK